MTSDSSPSAQTDRQPAALGRGMLIAGASVLVLAGIRAGSYLVVLIVFSLLVTLLLAPVQRRMLDRGLKPSVALVSCLALYVIVLGVAALVVLVGLADFVENLPSYQAALEGKLTSLVGSSELLRSLTAAIGDVAQGLISTIGSGVVVIGYSVIVVAYMLLEARRGRARLLWAARGNTEVVDRAADAGRRMQAFIVARTVLGLIAAIIETVVLIILGVPSALLWGVLSFLMSYVPNIGFIVALIPPAILALALNGPLNALAVVIAYSITNFAVDYVLQPRYIGSSVNMSALVVTLSIVFWGLILGPAGALLAIPMTIAAIAVADAFTDSRPFARLLVDNVEDGTD